MTYDELVKKVQKNYSALDASGVKEHVAVQFNIEGEAEGAFYVELNDGKADVEPYEYYDRDAIVTTSADVALKISDKTVELKDAYNNETAKVWGDLDKILYAFDQLVKAAAKAEDKKPAAKKAPAKKTEKKPAAKKPAAKKTTAKKVEAPKAAETKKAVEVKPQVEVKKPVEAKKPETKPVEAKKAETKTAEVKKPVAVKKTESKPVASLVK